MYMSAGRTCIRYHSLFEKKRNKRIRIISENWSFKWNEIIRNVNQKRKFTWKFKNEAILCEIRKRNWNYTTHHSRDQHKRNKYDTHLEFLYKKKQLLELYFFFSRKETKVVSGIQRKLNDMVYERFKTFVSNKNFFRGSLYLYVVWGHQKRATCFYTYLSIRSILVSLATHTPSTRTWFIHFSIRMFETFLGLDQIKDEKRQFKYAQ